MTEQIDIAGLTVPELSHLLELDALADTAASIAELAQMDLAAAADAYVAARRATDRADAEHAKALDDAVTERRRLGVILTASGYRTKDQIKTFVAAQQRERNERAG